MQSSINASIGIQCSFAATTIDKRQQSQMKSIDLRWINDVEEITAREIIAQLNTIRAGGVRHLSPTPEIVLKYSKTPPILLAHRILYSGTLPCIHQLFHLREIFG